MATVHCLLMSRVQRAVEVTTRRLYTYKLTFLTIFRMNAVTNPYLVGLALGGRAYLGAMRRQTSSFIDGSISRSYDQRSLFTLAAYVKRSTQLLEKNNYGISIIDLYVNQNLGRRQHLGLTSNLWQRTLLLLQSSKLRQTWRLTRRLVDGVCRYYESACSKSTWRGSRSDAQSNASKL